MGKYFGTDGFRGEAGITLTADHAYKVGRFLGWYYNALRERNGNNEPARIVIGKDTRRSSYMFEYSLVAGLTASGADAYLLHVTTTPSVAYIARVDDFDCGIMISASHNPYYDNGIKLIDCYGEKMPEEILLLVEDYIDGKLHVFDKDWSELPFAHREHIGRTVDYISGRNRYMGYLISLGIYSFKGVKVGLDCANGASWNIAKSVFDALGADTYVINNKPNGLNINNNAGSTHIESLQNFVVEKGLDVGFAYDGDADRCLCVDEKGNVITGDHILYIYGCYMKERVLIVRAKPEQKFYLQRLRKVFFQLFAFAHPLRFFRIERISLTHFSIILISLICLRFWLFQNCDFGSTRIAVWAILYLRFWQSRRKILDVDQAGPAQTTAFALNEADVL